MKESEKGRNAITAWINRLLSFFFFLFFSFCSNGRVLSVFTDKTRKRMQETEGRFIDSSSPRQRPSFMFQGAPTHRACVKSSIVRKGS